MLNDVLIKIPAKKEFISIVRYAASVYSNELGFDIERMEDIKLVISEALNNAVLHTELEDCEVEVKLYQRAESFVMEIRDSGKGFSLPNYEAPQLDKENCSGYGIYIMQTLSDSVEISSGDGKGTKLSIEFTIDNE